MNLLQLFNLIIKSMDCEINDCNYYLNLFLNDIVIEEKSPLEIYGTFLPMSLRKKTINANTSVANTVLLDSSLYYLYEECGHNGEWRISSYCDIGDLEKNILSPGGYLNMFTTSVIVIKNGKKINFNVYEMLDNAKKYVSDFDECKNISKLRVEWI